MTDKYSASEQGLGYIYQGRFALLRLLELDEDTSLAIEKDDDLDFADRDGNKSLASLKHKADSDRMSDLSIDFWKSVRIWLSRYKRDNRSASNLRFFLFTTGTVSDTSFLKGFLPNQDDKTRLTQQANAALDKSSSDIIGKITNEFNELTTTEKTDFLARITIFDNSPRIEGIPQIIKDKHMRCIRREHRDAVFERLEGWWSDEVIKLLTGTGDKEIFGFNVSDKLAALSEEYKMENLPITFRGKVPDQEIDTESDPRIFVVQLRRIGVNSNRIRSAILDYYRAFQQRSEWARKDLLLLGEIEDYEARLVDEWSRFRDVIFEDHNEGSAEEVLQQAGKQLYKWAETQTGNIESLRIRTRVSEPYITRGSFHILADVAPVPKVYWHPRFLNHLHKVLGVPK